MPTAPDTDRSDSGNRQSGAPMLPAAHPLATEHCQMSSKHDGVGGDARSRLKRHTRTVEAPLFFVSGTSTTTKAMVKRILVVLPVSMVLPRVPLLELVLALLRVQLRRLQQSTSNSRSRSSTGSVLLHTTQTHAKPWLANW